MATSNAGYGANRQGRFTRSGALRPLRLARLARCRWFRPSPCPTHYGGRLATMPSADFCPITPGVTARRAARVAVAPVGSHVCARSRLLSRRSPSGQPLAGLPLPSATSVICPNNRGQTTVFLWYCVVEADVTTGHHAATPES